MKKILIIASTLMLVSCAVDKCNDYIVAYDCVEQHGMDCRAHYIQMCEDCK